MKTKALPAKAVARKAAAKKASPIAAKKASASKVGGASAGARRQYQVYDTTVEPQHTTRDRIERAVALASQR